MLLQVDFPFQGPFGAAMAEGMRELAQSIAQEPGLIWKVRGQGRTGLRLAAHIKFLQIATCCWGEKAAEGASSHPRHHSLDKQVWTESEERQEAGGIYLFDTKENAQNYIAMHEARLKGFGIPVVNVKASGWQGRWPAGGHGQRSGRRQAQALKTAGSRPASAPLPFSRTAVLRRERSAVGD